MIVNTGARTDTVQYYTDWLLRRFAEGYVLSRNPLFPNKVTRYELPNIHALNFVMEDALGGGVTRSLAVDMHGKTLGFALLEMEI